MQSKIFVFKLKDIIRTGIFALLGIAAIAAIIGFVTSGSKSAYRPGTYNSEIVLHGSPVEVQVKVSRNDIESISMSELGETQSVFYPTFNSCFDDIAGAVVENQSTDIEVNKDYEVTGSILLQAVDRALESARR